MRELGAIRGDRRRPALEHRERRTSAVAALLTLGLRDDGRVCDVGGLVRLPCGVLARTRELAGVGGVQSRLGDPLQTLVDGRAAGLSGVLGEVFGHGEGFGALELHQEHAVLEREPLRGLAPASLERDLVPFEAVRVEERAQQRLPLVVLREQEPREPALREQDHLQELLLVQAEDRAELVADVDRTRRAAHPSAIDPLLQPRFGGALRRAVPVALASLVRRHPLDPPAPVAARELEPHPGGLVERRVVAAQTLLAVFVARNPAVEREADGIEDARLARAGLAADQEDAVLREGVEVDDLAVAERAEALDLEAVDPHAVSSATRASVTASSISAISRSLAP